MSRHFLANELIPTPTYTLERLHLRNTQQLHPREMEEMSLIFSSFEYPFGPDLVAGVNCEHHQRDVLHTAGFSCCIFLHSCTCYFVAGVCLFFNCSPFACAIVLVQTRNRIRTTVVVESRRRLQKRTRLGCGRLKCQVLERQQKEYSPSRV